MATLRPYALKNPKTDTIVPGALILSTVKPVSGNWFPMLLIQYPMIILLK